MALLAITPQNLVKKKKKKMPADYFLIKMELYFLENT